MHQCGSGHGQDIRRAPWHRKDGWIDVASYGKTKGVDLRGVCISISTKDAACIYIYIFIYNIELDMLYTEYTVYIYIYQLWTLHTAPAANEAKRRMNGKMDPCWACWATPQPSANAAERLWLLKAQTVSIICGKHPSCLFRRIDGCLHVALKGHSNCKGPGFLTV